MATPSDSIQILLIGATGFIGGTILSHITRADTSARISALVRQPKDVEKVKSPFPNVDILFGDLSNKQLLSAAAATVDIVIYAARNTHDGVDALMTGLSKAGPGEEKSAPQRRRLFILLSAIISLADPKNLRLGEPPLDTGSQKVMSDVHDATAIADLPDYHWHVPIERAFLRLAAETNARTDAEVLITPVIMGLPLALGPGAGPVRTTSFVQEYAKAVATRAWRRQKEGGEGNPPAAFIMGQGQNVWSWSTPRDIASAVWVIVDRWRKNTLPQPEQRQQEQGSGGGGYFYVESGQLIMKDLAMRVSRDVSEVMGMKKNDDKCESLQYPQFAEYMPELPGLWGVSARCRADRLRGMGWSPRSKSWEQVVKECVQSVVES